MGGELIVALGRSGGEGCDCLPVDPAQAEHHKGKGNDTADGKGQQQAPVPQDALAHPQQGRGPVKGVLYTSGIDGKAANHSVKVKGKIEHHNQKQARYDVLSQRSLGYPGGQKGHQRPQQDRQRCIQQRQGQGRDDKPHPKEKAVPHAVLGQHRADYPGGEHHKGREQQVFQVDGRHPAGHQQGGGHRHTQQQVVVLPAKHHALDGEGGEQQPAHQGGHAHKDEHQYLHMRGGQRLHQHVAVKTGEVEAQASNDNDSAQAGGRLFPAAAPGIGGGEQHRLDAHLQQSEKLLHFSPSSSRNTSSREESPTSSAVGPDFTSRPCLMMAILWHSFSATSSTWVEKNTAEPPWHSSAR